MFYTTKVALTAILNTDPTITADHKKAILAVVRSYTQKQVDRIPRVIRRDEAAHLLGVSVKRIDQLSHAKILKRVTVPGCSRAMGLTEASVRAIAEGLEADGAEIGMSAGGGGLREMDV